MSLLHRFFAWLPTTAAKGMAFIALALLFGARLLLERLEPLAPWQRVLDSALETFLWITVALAVASLFSARIRQRREKDSH